MLSKHLAAQRAHRLALTFLGALALICLRLWYLAIVCHDAFEERASRPQVRSEAILAERGAICDRFGLPLASNELRFEIAVRYGDIQNATARQLSASAAGMRSSSPITRARYVQDLAREIAEQCDLTSKQVCDQIFAKAALTPSLCAPIVKSVSYASFAALKLRCPLWPGLHPRVVSQRIYPLGRVGSHILGHMGLVDEGQLRAINGEMRSVASLLGIEENWLDRQMLQERLENLQSQFQRRSDRVGKAGLEKRMESYLKGVHGKVYSEVDARGRAVRRLVERGKPPQHGGRLDLSLCVELQQFAEALLARSETAREGALQRGNWPMPWIKGGAIAALDPNNGEVLALASSPTFDPNDFADSAATPQGEGIARWVESPVHHSAIWDGLVPLQRSLADENLNGRIESRYLTWPLFLQLACSQRDHLHSLLDRVLSVGDAFVLCRAFTQLQRACLEIGMSAGDEGGTLSQMVVNALYCDPEHSMNGPLFSSSADVRSKLGKNSHWRAALTICDEHLGGIERNDHKLLLLDLLRLLIDEERVSPELARCAMSLKEYKEHAQAFFRLERSSRQTAQQWFDANPFRKWQSDCQRYLVAARRLQEQQERRPTRPFTDYVEQEREGQFRDFWAKRSVKLISQMAQGPSNFEETNSDTALQSMLQRSIEGGANGDDLSILKRACTALRASGGEELVEAYLRSFRRFSQLHRPLLGRYPALSSKRQQERDLALSFCPRGGFGYMRSSAWRGATAQGSIFKLVIAYEALRQRWYPHCRFEQLNPLTMWDFVRQQGGRTFVGADQEGRLIRQLHSGGRLPRSSRREIGKIDVIGAITSSSNPYFSLLASEEIPLEDLQASIAQFGFGQLTGIELPGEVAGNIPDDLARNKTGLYNLAIGQHALAVTPLQTARMLAALGNGGQLITPHIVRIKENQLPHRGLFLPPEIRRILLEGMHRVSYSPEGCASTSAIRTFAPQGKAMCAYRSLIGQFVGKTSTAEIDVWTSIASRRPERCSHIWFGGISFDSPDKRWTRPELVVVVFLPHGTFGKEAAPIAAQMVTKWREIKRQRSAKNKTKNLLSRRLSQNERFSG